MKTDAGRALFALSIVLFSLRWVAKSAVGFGDSEALYACYTMHLAPAHLDHPGAIGDLLHLLGAPPSPEHVHIATTLLATGFPWVGVWAARACGADWRGAALAGLALGAAPLTAVGLFGATPDLPLAYAWLGAIGAVARALRTGSVHARDGWLAFAGLCSGVALAFKLPGALLVVAHAVVLARSATLRTRLFGWLGLGAGVAMSAPLGLAEFTAHFPMLQHRLVASQAGSGFSLRNLVAVPAGQLAYVGPLLAVAAGLTARSLWRRRNESAVNGLLFFMWVIPGLPLVAFSLWSRVAEPHWLAPAYLPLALFAGVALRLRPVATDGSIDAGLGISARFGRFALASSVGLAAFTYLWVLLPIGPRLLPSGTDMRYDIANELYGTPELARAVTAALRDSADSNESLAVVGPHWTLCAQVHAALGRDVPVSCEGPIPDDFSQWYPLSVAERADRILYVTDTRFERPSALLLRFYVQSTQRVHLMRGGRIVRTFTLSLLSRRGPG